MKIEDLAGNNIAVYDSNKERFTRFCKYLKKFKYRLRWNGDGTNVLVQRPCILVTKPNFVFLCEMALAVERNWLIVPTLSFEDFAEYERRHQREQAEKVKQIINKIFSKADRTKVRRKELIKMNKISPAEFTRDIAGSAAAQMAEYDYAEKAKKAKNHGGRLDDTNVVPKKIIEKILRDIAQEAVLKGIDLSSAPDMTGYIDIKRLLQNENN